jgi:hypothetical protein
MVVTRHYTEVTLSAEWEREPDGSAVPSFFKMHAYCHTASYKLMLCVT